MCMLHRTSWVNIWPIFFSIGNDVTHAIYRESFCLLSVLFRFRVGNVLHWSPSESHPKLKINASFARTSGESFVVFCVCVCAFTIPTREHVEWECFNYLHIHRQNCDTLLAYIGEQICNYLWCHSVWVLLLFSLHLLSHSICPLDNPFSTATTDITNLPSVRCRYVPVKNVEN